MADDKKIVEDVQRTVRGRIPADELRDAINSGAIRVGGEPVVGAAAQAAIEKARDYIRALSPTEQENFWDAYDKTSKAWFAFRDALERIETGLRAADLPAVEADVALARDLWATITAGRHVLSQFDADIKLGDHAEFGLRKRRIEAELDMLQKLVAEGLTTPLIASIRAIETDPRYPRIQAHVGESHAEIGAIDEPHAQAYVRTIAAYVCLKEDHPDHPDVAAIRRALDAYYATHFHSPDTKHLMAPESFDILKPATESDYAPGITDLKARVLKGYEIDGWDLTRTALNPNHTRVMSPDRHQVWRADFEAFLDASRRHEYSITDLREVQAAARSERDVADSAINRLQQVIKSFESGPSHLEALEQQFLALRINRLALGRYGSSGPLQKATIAALKSATAYCWSQMCVEAVASSAEGLMNDIAMHESVTDDIGAKCGWWWFHLPIPVQTLGEPHTKDPVVALLWRREYPPNEPPYVWFSAFTVDAVQLHGRMQFVPNPSAAWKWHDGETFPDLEARLAEILGEKDLSTGYAMPAHDTFIKACLWFSRFFMAASAWLSDRIIVSERGHGTRNVGRRIQREEKLAAPPTVEVIHLRRREVVQRVDDGSPSKVVNWRWQWTVKPFWRKQYYPSLGIHKPKYIHGFIKGPPDRPLKTAARVYAVDR